MATATSMNLREEVPVNIVKGANLESTMNGLFNNFETGEQRNADLVNKFFDQPYFRGEESLINKLIEINPNIPFDDIKDEGVNLALLLHDRWMRDFNDCLSKITNDELKKAFIQKIHDKILAKIGVATPYDHFDDPTECAIPGDANVLAYFQKVVDYLNSKENVANGKKTINILKKISITNEDLNSALPTDQIPAGVELTNPAVPVNTRNAFDILLSFEIGKEADRTIDISRDISKKLEGLFTNTLPAINTVIGENNELKFDESKLGKEYAGALETLNNDNNLSANEKENAIKNLKREYYLRYLKTKNKKLGDTLQQLYDNNFDYSKLDSRVLEDYLDHIASMRLRMLFDNGISELLKLNFGNLNQFSDFYKGLGKCSVNYIQLDPSRGIILPVEKTVVEGEHPWLKDINEFGENARAYDALPITYNIKKSDVNSLPIDLEDKTKLLNFLSRFKSDEESYTIEGENIGVLIYLFFIINTPFPITQFNLDKQKDIENLFGKAENHNEDTEGGEVEKEGNNPDGNNEGSGDGNDEGNEGYTPETFKTDIEKLGPGKFENGSEIWLPMGNSELPGGGYQWMKVKISNIDMKKGTFKGKVFGGELKFGGNLEGKSKEFKMNEEFLNKLKNISKESNKIWLQPDPDKLSFNSFVNKLNHKLGTSELSFPVSGVKWNGSKFLQNIVDEKGNEKEVEVKYFGAVNDDKSTYKVEYNPIRGSFTVSSTFNGEERGKNGKSEKKRFSYKRDMDWNNFLIFFTQKGLVPQTEREAADAVNRQDQEFKMANGGHWKLNRFSFNNIKNGFKDIIGVLKKKIDEYDKGQTEKFKKMVESPILNALSKLPLPASMKYAIGERQQEIYNEELNGAWKEIETYLKALQSDGQFADTFDQVPPHVQTLYGKSYQKFIIDLREKGETSTEEKRKAAALLLANYEKGGSPFRGLSNYENKGLRVKILLGEDHYKQFLRDKAACIRDRDLAESSKNSGLDKKGLNEQLATCEMDYIINNVRGAYPKLPGSYFPSHENRGINGDKSTNYIPNPSKRLLSETFANKLEDAKKGRFTKDSVNDSYSKNKSINRFEVMEDEFGKMGSSRYKQGAGALRRMFDLAADESLKKRAKRHFLTYLLSGALDVNCDPGLKKQVYGWAKPMSFVPGMLVKEAGVAENIAILLDDATGGDFSRNVTKYFHRNGQLKGGVDFKALQGEINNWLTNEKMDELDKYFSELPTNDFSNVTDSKKKAVLQKFKKALIEEDVEEFDRGLLDNPTMVNNGLLTNINVISDRLRIDEGEFKGKDSDDISNKKSFWNSISGNVSLLDRKSNDPKTVNFVLEKYFTRFGINSKESRQGIYRRINTAYAYKKEIDEHGGICKPKPTYKLENGTEIQVPLGTITQKDVDKILLYALEGNIWTRCNQLRGQALPQELKNALDSFQTFFTNAFNSGSLNDDEVKNGAFKSGGLGENDIFYLGGWDAYKKIKNKDILNGNDIDDEGSVNGRDQLKPSQKKEILRRVFNENDKYINPDMESIYNTLKRNRNTLDNKRSLSILDDESARIEDLRRSLAA